MSISKKPREANMDLLRIVSMLLIVFLHSIDHSGVLENAENCGTGMYLFVRFTYALCQVCVNIYVMLSGFFMINSKFRLSKLFTLWTEAAFYSFVLKLLFMLLGKESFSLISLASCFLPITTGRYWFLTIYVGMYLLSPFLNICVRAMTGKQHGILNLCLFAIMSLWSSIHPAIAGMNSGGGWGLAWFVVLYLLAAWLKLYYSPKHRPWRWFAMYVSIPAIMAVGQLFARKMGIGILNSVISNWFSYDSAPVYIMTVCLFVGFMNVKINIRWLSKAIVFVAPLTLGVYLIHAHANVSPWSWEFLDLPAKMNSVVFPLVQLACVVGIFVICAAIAFVRNITLGRLENGKWVTGLWDKVESTSRGVLLKMISKGQEK